MLADLERDPPSSRDRTSRASVGQRTGPYAPSGAPTSRAASSRWHGRPSSLPSSRSSWCTTVPTTAAGPPWWPFWEAHPRHTPRGRAARTRRRQRPQHRPVGGAWRLRHLRRRRRLGHAVATSSRCWPSAEPDVVVATLIGNVRGGRRPRARRRTSITTWDEACGPFAGTHGRGAGAGHGLLLQRCQAGQHRDSPGGALRHDAAQRRGPRLLARPLRATSVPAARRPRRRRGALRALSATGRGRPAGHQLRLQRDTAAALHAGHRSGSDRRGRWSTASRRG